MISLMIHARRPLKGLATALALASVIAAPGHGRAESRTSEHRTHPNALARPPAPMFRTRMAVAFPTAQMPPAVASATPPAMGQPRETSYAGDREHHDRGPRVIVVVVPSVYDYGPPPYSEPPADDSANGCAQTFGIYDPKLGGYVDDVGNLYHCP